jgi:FkbM family methyltransferase
MSLARLFRRRQPIPFARWGWKVRDFRLPAEGLVQFAQWQHPATSITDIEQAEIDGLRQWIRPGDFAIDVGAHTGDTSVPMALAAGPAGCILALEPNRYAFDILAANARLNPDATRIDARCCAATPHDGQFTFLYGDASYCNGGAAAGRWNPFRRKYPLAVEGQNLFRLLREEFSAWLPRLRYVKVDAEGHDLSILESILPVLRELQPVVRTEVFKKLPANDRHALYDLLADAGYSVHRYLGGAAPQGQLLARGDMTAIRHFDVLAVPLNRGARRAA